MTKDAPVLSPPEGRKPPAGALVLITGGGGYVGSALARHLLSGGWRVRLLDAAWPDMGLRRRIGDGSRNGALEVRSGDVCDPKDVRRACKDVTHIVHLAGIANVNACKAHPRLSLEVNGYSTRHLLECVKDRKDMRRFIYPSSVAGMYTVPRRGKIVETTPVFPVNDYGISKYLGEQFCRAYARLFGVQTVIFRQSNVYGPSPRMKYDNVIHRFAANALQGKDIEIHGTGKQARDFLFLDDLLKAYESALWADVPAGREYNICNGENVSILRVAEDVVGIAGASLRKRVRIRRKPGGEEIEIRRFSISGGRARKELGFAPRVPLYEGLKRLFESLRRTSPTAAD